MEHDDRERIPSAEPHGRSTWKAEDIPRAFLAVATHRDRVNGMRVVAGDKRMQLHRELENLTLSVQTLQKDFQPLLSRLSDDVSRDASAHLEQFKGYLGSFLKTKMAYDDLDDELGGAEYLLSEDERRVYNRLAMASSPLPSTFNKSMSSFSLHVPRFSGEGPVDDFSSVSSNSFELIYGYGTTVGERPFQKPAIRGQFPPQARQAAELLPIVPDSMAHLDHLSRGPRSTGSIEPFSRRTTFEVIATESPPNPLAGQTEDQRESVEAGYLTATTEKPIVSYSQSDLDRFPPLFLSDRAEALLDYLVAEFNSTNDRINRWLLHMLRSSPWEIRRFYLYFVREAERTRSHVRDETTWSLLVLAHWIDDIQPRPGSVHTAPVTASFDQSAEIQATSPTMIRPVGRNCTSVPDGDMDPKTHNANYMETYAAVVKQQEQYGGLSRSDEEQPESLVRETGTRFPEDPLEDPGVPDDLEELQESEPSTSEVTASRNTSASSADATTLVGSRTEVSEVQEAKVIPGLEKRLDVGKRPEKRQRPSRKRRSDARGAIISIKGDAWTRRWLRLKGVCKRYSRLR
ncbi:hypothetical protein VTN02DRAFT_1568 [Thermoascus thermophilus]